MGGGGALKGRCKGKKLVEQLLFKLVWQMLEHGDLTPQSLDILHCYHCNDGCSVNTKLREKSKVNGNSYSLHKVACSLYNSQ